MVVRVIAGISEVLFLRSERVDSRLVQHDPTPDRDTIVLAKLRGVPSTHPTVQHEPAEILDAISLEAKENGFQRSWYSGKQAALSCSRHPVYATGYRCQVRLSQYPIARCFKPSC